MKLSLFIAALLSLLSLNSQAQTITLTIEGLRNSQGIVSVGIFKNQEQFAKEKPVKKQLFPKTTMKAGLLVVELKLEPGNYGFALLDDENKDAKMNYNWIGVPLEGFGFSNYVSSGLSKPEYSDFDFVVKPGENKVHIKMRYI